jgi:hypothetical protein
MVVGGRIQLYSLPESIVALATGNYCNPHLTTSTKFHHVCLEAIPPCYLARLGRPVIFNAPVAITASRILGVLPRWPLFMFSRVPTGTVVHEFAAATSALLAAHRRKRFRFEDDPPVLEVLAASGGCYECRRWGRRCRCNCSDCSPPSTIETSRGATLPSARTIGYAFTGIRQFFPGRNNAT